MRFLHFLIVLSLCGPAGGLERLWCADTGLGARGVPLVADHDRDGTPEAVTATRDDGTLWAVGGDGERAGQFPGPRPLAGGVSAARGQGLPGGVYAYRESAGHLNAIDFRASQNLTIALGSPPLDGLSPVMADLDGNGRPEIIAASADGRIHAVHAGLVPLWVTDLGAPMAGPIAAAPVFESSTGLFCATRDGRLHALDGSGRMLWNVPAPAENGACVTLVVREGAGSLVLVTGGAEVAAFDPGGGGRLWTRDVPGLNAGWPAIAVLEPAGGPEILVLTPRGRFEVLSLDGELLGQGQLPPGEYLPRPLVADVDGDDAPELVAATAGNGLLVSDLEGRVEGRLPLGGNVRDGFVLADLAGDEALELVAVGDDGTACCFATSARDGWTHPRGNAAFTGAAGTAEPALKAPEHDAPRRRVRAAWAVTTPWRDSLPLATAHIGLKRAPRRAARFTATVSRDGRPVGGAAGRLAGRGFVVPFAVLEDTELSVHATLYDADGHAVAALRETPLARPRPEPVELAPVAPFVAALEAAARHWSLPPSWAPGGVGGKDYAHVVKHAPRLWNRLDQDQAARLLARGVPVLGLSDDFNSRVLHSIEGPMFLDHPDGAFSASAPPPLAAFPEAGFPRVLGAPVLLESGPGMDSNAMAARIRRLRERSPVPLVSGSRDARALVAALASAPGEKGAGLPVALAYARVGDGSSRAALDFARLRGNARRAGGVPWGVSISNEYAGTLVDVGADPDAPPRREGGLLRGANCGHSPAAGFRLAMAARLAGASFIHHAQNALDGSIYITTDAEGQYKLSSYGKGMAQSLSSADAAGSRPVPFTPAALLTGGARSADPLLDMVFGPGDAAFERGTLGGGALGGFFDVLDAGTPPEALARYGILWAADLPAEKAAALAGDVEDYVRRGGVFFLDAGSPLAGVLGRDFLGVRFGRTRAAASLQSAAGAVPRLEAPFEYAPLKRRWRSDAEYLVWTGSGDPLVAWRRVGRGVLVVSGTRDWLDARGGLLPLPHILLGLAVDAFLPVERPEGVTMFLARAGDRWTIGLSNEDGLTKRPADPLNAEARATRNCLLRFSEEAPLRFHPRAGEFRWDIRGGGLRTRVLPGAFAVVDVEF